MSSFGGFGVPGMGALAETNEYELFWGGDRSKGLILGQSAKYSGTIRDAGNTPTTVIRAGLLLGQISATSELEEWDASQASAATGTQNIFGVLATEIRAQDFDGNDQDRVLDVVIRAPLKVNTLLIQGSAFVGHVDEYLARRQLVERGCVLDDDAAGFKAGAITRYIEKVTDYTVVEADNGTVFTSTTADTDYTLPTIKAGLKFDFLQTADFEMTVISAGSLDNIIGANDASLDQVQFTTAGEQIGARMCFESVYVGTTLKWLYYIKKVAFSTDDYLVSAAT